MEQRTVEQGTQPTFGDVLVGVVRVGERGGVPTVRLLLTTAEGAQTALNLVVGDEVPLPGGATLQVTGIGLPGNGVRGTVTLTQTAPAEVTR